MKTWTFHIVTFGCKVNQYESQALREAWLAQGGLEVETPAAADVALVNSCAVTARGERDARNALYRLHRAAPQGKRILTGCSACLAGTSLQDPTCLDVLVPPRAKSLLMQGPWPLLAAPHIPLSSVTTPFGEQGFRISAFRRARPVLKVQDGCSHRCTYCIVPLMRGPAISRPLPEILREAQGLLQAGHGEIMISGINLHQYGRDMRQPEQSKEQGDFWDLLEKLDSYLAPRWAGKARLRISSLEPSQLTPRGLDTLAACRMVCPHAHLSLQHGSPAILRRMGRGHCRPQRLIEAVQNLRKIWPTMGLGADILMGFPGESDDDVQTTLHVVRALGLTYAHVFPYSARPGTPAARFAEQIPHKERLARAATVRHAVHAQQKAFWHSLLDIPELTVALDARRAAGSEAKGVDAHYVPCRLTDTPDAENCADKTQEVCSGRSVQDVQGMITVRPMRVEKDALVVQPLK